MTKQNINEQQYSTLKLKVNNFNTGSIALEVPKYANASKIGELFF